MARLKIVVRCATGCLEKSKKNPAPLVRNGKSVYICIRFQKERQTKGAVAQLVEHRTENPGVGGSTPPRTTIKNKLCFKRYIITII